MLSIWRCSLVAMILYWSCVCAWAQQFCPDKFPEIGLGCIQGFIQKIDASKFTRKPMPLSSEMNGKVYFYRTGAGEIGKLKVISVQLTPNSSKPRECSVSLDAVTYSKEKVFVPNSSLLISAKKSNFLNDIMYLNDGGSSALEMRRLPTNDEGKIVLDEKIDVDNPAEVKDAESGIKPVLTQARIDSHYQKAIAEAEKLDFESAEKARNKANSDRQLMENKLSRSQMRCFIVPSADVQMGFYKHQPDSIKREENNLLFYAPLVLIFIAIFLIVRVFMEDQDKYKTQEALEEAENSKQGKNQPLFIKITKPFYKRYFLPAVQGSKNKQGFRNKYRQKIANAGLTKEMTPEEFVALKFFMILGGPFAFLTVRFVMEETWPLSITPAMAIIGYFYPDIWLSGLVSRRADETLRAMPFIVDMLALSVEAGLDFMAAIQKVIDKAPKSPLVEEFETLIRETKIGSTRAEGLRQLGWRVNIIEINSFCATLIAADSVGASIAPILKQLSGELRVKRSSRAEQQGATAATKILIPMIFFILPAVLVAIFAPMVLKMMTGKL